MPALGGAAGDAITGPDLPLTRVRVLGLDLDELDRRIAEAVLFSTAALAEH